MSETAESRMLAGLLAVEEAGMSQKADKEPQAEPSPAQGPQPSQQELAQAFGVFMAKAAELEASHVLLQGKVRDLTEELAVKVTEVEKLKDHLSNVLENVADAVVAIDAEGRVTSFNRAAEELFGQTEERMRGRELTEAGALAAPLAGLVGAALAGGERRRSEERVAARTDGSEAVLLLSAAPLRDDAGRLVGAAGSATDITQLRDLERALARRERLAALGEMAAVLAHEIRNPLGGIQLYAGILGRSDSLTEEERGVVSKLSRGVTGLNKLVEDMLAFAREIVADRKRQDVRMPVESALQGALPEFEAKGVAVARLGWDRPLEAAVDGDLLSRAVLNLLLNAAEAVEPGGHVEIAARFEVAGGRRFLTLRVSDDGRGLDAPRLEQVFDPFYTTKAQGTGLGLAVVSRIAAAHGGEVKAELNEGGGASFVLRLPAD